MAVWFTRSGNVARHLKRNMGFLGKLNHSFLGFHQRNSSLVSPIDESYRNAVVVLNNAMALFSVRCSESTLAEAQRDSRYDEHENQILDFPGGQVTFTSEMRFISESPEKRTKCYQVLDDNGRPILGTSFQPLSKEFAVRMYSNMVTLQTMDTIFYEAQRQGRISFYVTSNGEEAINIASAAALTFDDVVLPQVVKKSQEFSFGVVSPCKNSQINALGTKVIMGKVVRCQYTMGPKSSITSPYHQQLRDGIVVRGQAYGVRSIRVDGNDALAVYTAVQTAREMAISEHRPILIEALTYRVGHHSTSDDSTKYRPVDEIEHWRMARDPVTRFRKWVEWNGWWSDEDESELRSSARKQILHAIQVAEKVEKPPLSDLFTDVYDHLPSNLLEQERLLRETIKRHPQDYPPEVPM